MAPLLMDTIIFSVVFAVLGILNVSGNVLVMAVIVRNKTMRTPVNYLLFSLAVPDLLVGVTSIANRVVMPYVPHPQGNAGVVFCKLITLDNLFYICGHTSVLILAVIAYERYQAVVHPYTVTEKITSKKMMGAVAVCWAISIALCSNWIYLARIDSEQKCGYDYQTGTTFFLIFRYLNGISYFVPLVVMVMLYGKIVWTMMKKQDQVLNRQQLAATRLRRKVTTMLLVATLAFIATCAPLNAITLAQTSITFFATVEFDVKTLMASLNSTVNAFIYALFSSQFRQGFKSILSCSSSEENCNSVKTSEEDGHSNNTIDTKL